MTMPIEAKSLIQSATRILIICHIMPDGDAIGSLLGVGWALRKLGKNCTLTCADPVPERYRFLPGHEEIRTQSLGNEDLIITLDSSDTERLGALYDAATFALKPVINIDHHITNIKFGRVNWVEQVASTAELGLALTEALEIPLDATIATCLLTGLVTDTRCFRTPNTTKMVLGHAITLLEAGASLAQVTEKAFGQNNLARLCIWGKALDCTEMRDGVIWAQLSREDFKSCRASWQDTEDLVSFLISTRGINASVLFQERESDKVEASMRAISGVDISGVAFGLGGGGHPQAAGCSIQGTMEQVKEKVLSALFLALREQGRLS
jgi:phosphoesterase RecJ-like protein